MLSHRNADELSDLSENDAASDISLEESPSDDDDDDAAGGYDMGAYDVEGVLEQITEEEFAVMRRHPELGAQLLASYPELDPIDIEVAYCHHMRDENLGYPNPAFPVKPGPVTAVVQVADMFEALTAHHDGYAVAPVNEEEI